jgi:hypothetical protein
MSVGTLVPLAEAHVQATLVEALVIDAADHLHALHPERAAVNQASRLRETLAERLGLALQGEDLARRQPSLEVDERPHNLRRA